MIRGIHEDGSGPTFLSRLLLSNLICQAMHVRLKCCLVHTQNVTPDEDPRTWVETFGYWQIPTVCFTHLYHWNWNLSHVTRLFCTSVTVWHLRVIDPSCYFVHIHPLYIRTYVAYAFYSLTPPPTPPHAHPIIVCQCHFIEQSIQHQSIQFFIV